MLEILSLAMTRQINILNTLISMRSPSLHNNLILAMVMCAFTSGDAYASGCDSYPYTDGLNVEEVSGGTKIISTASVAVLMDDVDSIKDARTEAILEAKAAISKFFNESTKSEEVINRSLLETKSMQGGKKDSSRKEVVERVKRLQNSSQALLRGAVVIGDCYSRGREVRVSLGINPEAINSISTPPNAVKGIGASNKAKRTKSQASSQNPPGSDSNRINEYSNDKEVE